MQEKLTEKEVEKLKELQSLESTIANSKHEIGNLHVNIHFMEKTLSQLELQVYKDVEYFTNEYTKFKESLSDKYGDISFDGEGKIISTKGEEN